MTMRHKAVVVLLFLYRLLWGFFLYRFIDSVMSPILARYPNEHPFAGAAELFAVEAQFRLLRTDLANETLLTLAGLLLLRALLTPLLNAGISYSLAHSNEKDGTRMLAGIRRAWKPAALLYGCELALLAAPGFWLLPYAKERFFEAGGSLSSWLAGLLPLAGGWIVWGFLLHLAAQGMLFSAVSDESVWHGIVRIARKGLPLALVTLVMIGFGLGASAAASAISLYWSGFLAVALHQGFHFIRSLLTLWTTASQYDVWQTSSSS